MLKIVLVVCFAAYTAAEAEADAKPDAGLLYAGYGHGLGAYGYSGLGYYGKRSADAEPEAEPEAKADAGLLYGGYGYGLGLGYAGLGYRGLGYAGYGYGLGSYGYSG